MYSPEAIRAAPAAEAGTRACRSGPNVATATATETTAHASARGLMFTGNVKSCGNRTARTTRSFQTSTGRLPPASAIPNEAATRPRPPSSSQPVDEGGSLRGSAAT